MSGMTITIPMFYYYVGSTNCSITLDQEEENEAIILLSSYGEIIAIVSCGEDLATVLTDLSAGKFADHSLEYLLEHADEI